LQRERYVHGRDLADRAVIEGALAAALGGSAAQWRQRIDDDALSDFAAERAAQAQHWMRATAAHGVPTLALPTPNRTARALPGNWFFDATPLAQHLAELG